MLPPRGLVWGDRSRSRKIFVHYWPLNDFFGHEIWSRSQKMYVNIPLRWRGSKVISTLPKALKGARLPFVMDWHLCLALAASWLTKNAGSCNFPSNTGKFSTEEIMGAHNFIFISNFLKKNWNWTPKFALLVKKILPTTEKFFKRLKLGWEQIASLQFQRGLKKVGGAKNAIFRQIRWISDRIPTESCKFFTEEIMGVPHNGGFNF